MKIPNFEHEAHPWVIGRIAPDFKLLDVWALPVHGGPDDFEQFLQTALAFDPANTESKVVRTLFAVRLRLGKWFGWDEPKPRPIPGATETTLSERLPDELKNTATMPPNSTALQQAAGGFAPLYRTDDEWAAELSNGTVHGVLHLAWVPEGGDRYRGQLAVYVKPRGKFGEVYMAMIEPFRRYIVYPALTRRVGRAWERRNQPLP